MPALIVGNQVRSQIKTVSFLKVVTESLPQAFNTGWRKQIQGHRELATILRTLEPWVTPSLWLFLWPLGAKKSAREEASASKFSLSHWDWPGQLLSPATKELCELCPEDWDRECLSNSLAQGH